MVEFVRVHHVQLAIPAGGEARARAFWTGVLGWTEVDKPAALAGRGGCWFRSGGVEVHLGVDAPFVAAAKAHPGIAVRGLGQLIAELRGRGVEVRIDDALPGYRRCYVADPFGNRLEFLEALGDLRTSSSPRTTSALRGPSTGTGDPGA